MPGSENWNWELAEYVVNRFVGIWQQRYISTLNKAKKEIVAEWARMLCGRQQQEVDQAIAALRGSEQWKERLKGFPPSVDEFLEVMKRGQSCNIVPMRSPAFEAYRRYLSEKEQAMTCRMHSVERDKFRDAYEFLRGMRELLANVEAGRITSPLYCSACSNYAVYFDRNKKNMICMGHYGENLK